MFASGACPGVTKRILKGTIFKNLFELFFFNFLFDIVGLPSGSIVPIGNYDFDYDYDYDLIYFEPKFLGETETAFLATDSK